MASPIPSGDHSAHTLTKACQLSSEGIAGRDPAPSLTSLPSPSSVIHEALSSKTKRARPSGVLLHPEAGGVSRCGIKGIWALKMSAKKERSDLEEIGGELNCAQASPLSTSFMDTVREPRARRFDHVA